MSSIASNLARVQDRIAIAAEAAGRSPSDITLVGVTKYVGASETAELVRAGCTELGESRPQQLWEKAADEQLRSAAVRWHLIGHLQRNKVNRTLPLTALVHGVDSPRLLKAINTAAAGNPTPQQLLLEVNCSGDSEKHGFTPDALREFAPQLGDYQAVEICGLMTMASREGGEKSAREAFALLRDLQGELQPLVPDSVKLRELSMGMSGDFEAAIAEGATMVRVGSALWEGIRGG